MIDILKNYYEIEIDYVKEYGNGVLFFVNDIEYYLMQCNLKEDELDKYVKLSLELNNKNILLHNFVLNKNGLFISNGYILFKLNCLDCDITLFDINKFNRATFDNTLLDYIPFNEFWWNKLDYMEYQLNQLSSVKTVNNSFDYFYGLTEVLIQYYNNNVVVDDICLVHRVMYSLSSIDFYNPLNVTLGSRYKDITSYIKINNDLNLLKNLIFNVSDNDKKYIFIRMCLPIYYFKYVSDIIIDNSKDDNLCNYLNDISIINEFLLDMEELFNIKLFYWIKKRVIKPEH